MYHKITMNLKGDQVAKKINISNKELIKILKKKELFLNNLSNNISNIDLQKLFLKFNKQKMILLNKKYLSLIFSYMQKYFFLYRDHTKSYIVKNKRSSLNNQHQKNITFNPPILVKELAILLNIKPFKLISNLMELGIFASLDQLVDPSIAIKIANTYGLNLSIKTEDALINKKLTNNKTKKNIKKIPQKILFETRPPIVSIMGHVDHGKTTLLDAIRKTNVVSEEAGGITQKIGSYQIIYNDKKITFLDTPGHEAFLKMRERGIQVTDIVILLIAADDGFKKQTDEILNFTKKNNIPIIVVINKIDTKGANIEKIKQQMQKRNITSEDYGGDTLCIEISALNKTNLIDLLELILLQAEMLDIKVKKQKLAEGTIIESQMETGKGIIATGIVQKGILKKGDTIFCQNSYCKIKALINDNGLLLNEVYPSTPIKILGWDSSPMAGEEFKVRQNEKKEKKRINLNLQKTKKINILSKNKTINIDKIFAQSASLRSDPKKLNIILKTDMQGSSEAIFNSIISLAKKTTKIKIDIIHNSVGFITQSDILTAKTTKSIIIGFNVKFEKGMSEYAKKNDISVIQDNIIYELINKLEKKILNFIDPEIKEQKLGYAEIRKIFKNTKGSIAGCMVLNGIIMKDKLCRIIRDKKTIFEGTIITLKRFQDDYMEVKSGYECGIKVNGFQNYEIQDIIYCFQKIKINPSL